jgi:hypothetical protein
VTALKLLLSSSWLTFFSTWWGSNTPELCMVGEGKRMGKYLTRKAKNRAQW